MNLHVERVSMLPVDEQPVELLERKGKGHPDTLCDHLVDAMSQALCEAYLETAGRVLHHNIENALLVPGRASPALGGGRVLSPMRFVYGEHATGEVDGKRLEIAAICEDAAKRWLAANLPLIDPERHIVFQNELSEGSVQLKDIFARKTLGSNDTCMGSGYAPLSRMESLVLWAEQYLNEGEGRRLFPELGQDIKVTGYRAGRRVELTASIAFVDAHIPSERAYFERKNAVAEALQKAVCARAPWAEGVKVSVNTLDRPGRGLAGMHLTVVGTSAEAADGGEVGRSNGPLGVKSFQRPVTLGSVAGKNPAANVGKIYNLFACDLAQKIHDAHPAAHEVYVTLASQIGEPIDHPLVLLVRLVGAEGAPPDVDAGAVASLAKSELSAIESFAKGLVQRPVRY